MVGVDTVNEVDMTDPARGPQARDNAVVTYSVADLLGAMKTDMTAGFASLHEAMKGKADKADLAEIKGQLEGHEKMISVLAQKQALDDRARVTEEQIRNNRLDWRKWGVPTLLSVLGTGALIASLFHL
jgi:hypothetical protein